MLTFNKNFLICSVFAVLTVSCMDFPTKQNGRPRSKSDSCLNQTSHTWIDSAVERGLQNAQKKLEPMIKQLLAESDQRIVKIMQQDSTSSDKSTDNAPWTLVGLLNRNVTMFTQIIANNTSFIPKQELEKLLAMNQQAYTQVTSANTKAA